MLQKFLKPIESESRVPPVFNEFEQMMIGENNAIDRTFRDEKLLMRLLYSNPVPQYHMPRGYISVLESTLDRMDWKVDADKLANHGYLNAHGHRPYTDEKYVLLKQYIDANY